MSHPSSAIGTICTIGHSTRSLPEFLALLAGNGIELVADVRQFPGSKRYPHFNREELERTLAQADVGFRHYPELGGRRKDRAPDSPNSAWRVEAFNAFADYMATEEFEFALEDLMARARASRTVVMCSEAVPWRCHRRLISDALCVRGWSILDIVSATKVTPHALTEFARIDGPRVTYPAKPLLEANDTTSQTGRGAPR